MPRGTPVDPTETYADEADVLRYTRNDDANLSTSDIEQLLKQKTRQIETETPEAFRDVVVSREVEEVDPSRLQKRDNLNRRAFRNHRQDRVSISSVTSDRWIPVFLDNNYIQEITSIEVITDAGVEDITSDRYDSTTNEGLWRIRDFRRGLIEVDYLAFKQTLSGTKGNDKLKGARVRVDYDYGRDEIEEDIREAVAKLVYYDLISSDAHGNIRTADDNTGFVLPGESTERFKQDAKDIIDSYS